MRRLVAVVAIAGLVIAGCSREPSSAEYDDLEEQLARAEQRIDELEADRGDPYLSDSIPMPTVSPDVPVGEGFDARWIAAGRLPMFRGALAAAGDTMVAVGGMLPLGEVAAFYSADGFEWEPASGMSEDWVDGSVRYEWQAGAGLSGAAEGRTVLAANSQGFVAVVDPDGDDWPVVAFSADGSSWDQIEIEFPVDDTHRWRADVVAGPGGFVMFFDGIIKESFAASSLVWFSDDGRNWIDTDLPLELFYTVASGESGWMALGGESVGGELVDTELASVFISDDGIHWNEVDAKNPPPAELMNPDWGGYWGLSPIAFKDGTWLTIRGHGSALSPAWISSDNGASWDEIVISDDWHLKQYTEIGDIAVTADGFLVAANLAYQGPGPARNLLLFSEDGTSWEVHRAVSDLVSMEALGDEIVALDDAGIVYFWNPT